VKIVFPRVRNPIITACLVAQLVLIAGNILSARHSQAMRNQALDYYKRVNSASDTIKKAYAQVTAIQEDSKQRYADAEALIKKANGMVNQARHACDAGGKASLTLAAE
jgi:hypothetical protein